MCRSTDLPAGHELRRTVGRALVFTGVTAAAFTAFAVLTTQVHAVRSGSPWQDDPYDAVVSFTEFFVPPLAVLGAIRALLCRRDEPLPVVRVDQLLRLAKAIGFLVGITVVTDVVALALRADRRLWNGLTPVSIAALAVVVAALGVSGFAVWRAHHAVRRLVGAAADQGDWLGDLPVLASRLTSSWQPRHRRPALAFAAWTTRWPALHRHLAAAMVALALLVVGATLSGAQAWREGYPASLFVFGTLLFAGTTWAGLVIVNRYLSLVAVPHAETRAGRAARVSFVLGCLVLPVVGGLRDLIWQALGVGPYVRTPGQLCLVTFGGGGLVTVIAFFALLAASATGPSTNQQGTRRSPG
ncbi:MAG: hypothetical protein ACR2KG_06885 [Nocardioidaceae bacterium]